MLRGTKHSNESLAKMASAHRGMSPTTRARMSAAQLGKTHSAETKAKMSASRRGVSKSPDTIAKIRSAQAFPLGSKNVTGEGYIQVKASQEPDAPNGGWEYEHRVVAAQMLARPLDAEEVVHHLDGNKQNNDPANLHVFESNSAHRRHHMRKAVA